MWRETKHTLVGARHRSLSPPGMVTWEACSRQKAFSVRCEAHEALAREGRVERPAEAVCGPEREAGIERGRQQAAEQR